MCCSDRQHVDGVTRYLLAAASLAHAGVEPVVPGSRVEIGAVPDESPSGASCRAGSPWLGTGEVSGNCRSSLRRGAGLLSGLSKSGAAEMPSMEGTPMLSIVVGEEERAEADLELDEILREGARRMLVAALRGEVDEYI